MDWTTAAAEAMDRAGDGDAASMGFLKSAAEQAGGEREKIPTYLPTYLPSYLSTYLPTYLPIYREI